MFTCKIENEAGEVLELTGRENEYQVYQIDGLTPPTAQINTSTLVGLDGERFNSSKLNTRHITIMMKINGNVEANRLRLYQYARTKEKIRFYITTASRDVYIDGYVESLEVMIFAMVQVAQIGILCPYPYFSALDEILAYSTNVSAGFMFPFAIDADDPVVISEEAESDGIIIYNSSEAETGTVINIRFVSGASSIKIQNTGTGDEFQLNYTFLAGDVVIVNTNVGQKSITLVRNGNISNLFSALVPGSAFPELEPGTNVFDYLVDGAAPTGQVEMQFRYRNVYRGV